MCIHLRLEVESEEPLQHLERFVDQIFRDPMVFDLEKTTRVARIVHFICYPLALFKRRTVDFCDIYDGDRGK